MKIILILIALLSFKAQAAWDLNDVSYLMPLPSGIGGDGLLRTDAAGKLGALLNPNLVDSIPVLTDGPNRGEVSKALRVMGVRIDPCFPLPTPQSCQNQIRLIWQPLDRNFDGEVQTVDTALHSFYVLTDTEFKSLLKDLTAWKKKYAAQTESLPLQVHPAWAAEGAQSASLGAFKTIILKYAGNANLSRVTAMLVRRGGLMWTFVGYSVVNGKLEPFDIPRLDKKKTQMFINLAFPMDHFANGGMSPAPRGADIVNTIVTGSDLLSDKDEETIRREAKAAFRIENPKTFNPENMDCVSCHVAMPALHWVMNKQPHLKVDQIWAADTYKNAKYDLSNLSPEPWNTRSIRAMGYFGKNMALSQRVINESAEVADALNSGYTVP